MIGKRSSTARDIRRSGVERRHARLHCAQYTRADL
jgi:hypothetical protein